MSGFVFRLQSLLNLRCAERDRCREALASAYRASEILTGQMTGIREAMQQLRRDMRRDSAAGPVDVDRLLSAHRYELLLASQLAQLEHRQQRIAVEIERRREALIRADQQVRTVEKLRERKLAEHRAAEAKREQRVLDEVGQRCARQEPGGAP